MGVRGWIREHEPELLVAIVLGPFLPLLAWAMFFAPAPPIGTMWCVWRRARRFVPLTAGLTCPACSTAGPVSWTATASRLGRRRGCHMSGRG